MREFILKNEEKRSSNLWKCFCDGIEAARKLQEDIEGPPWPEKQHPFAGTALRELLDAINFLACGTEEHVDANKFGKEGDAVWRVLCLVEDFVAREVEADRHLEQEDAALIAALYKAFDDWRAAQQREFYRQELRKLPYREYLKTPYWLSLREKAQKRAGGRCFLCSRKRTLHTHHRSYANLGDPEKELEDLVVLCDECHGKFHDKIPARE